MRHSVKPIRKCYSCPLNMGDHCWIYTYPRGQWRGERKCSAFDNEAVLYEFKQWQKLPTVKTSKELRREFFRRKPGNMPRRSLHGR
jgi:hypothetical protein